jgi:hypothetical protein
MNLGGHVLSSNFYNFYFKATTYRHYLSASVEASKIVYSELYNYSGTSEQARLRSANMLRGHGQAEQGIFKFLYTPNYPIDLFAKFSNPIPVQSSFFKKSKYFEDQQTNRPTNIPT